MDHPTTPTSPGTAPVIPVLDVGACFAGAPGALDRAAGELRVALEQIGFFSLAGHGVAPQLLERIFAETRRFHEQPLAEKMKLHMNRSNNGYLPLRGSASRHSPLNADPKPNENESFFARRERDPRDPDVLAGKDLRGPNQWPEQLPGFREAVLDYMDAMGRLGRRLLPVYARALDLPDDHFQPFFGAGGEVTLRLLHYPPATEAARAGGVFGAAAHTDRSLFTLVARADSPGLEILRQDGEWMSAPVVPGTFVVNAGDALRRWSNDRVLSTPHRVLNASGRDRHSVAFFVAPEFDTILDCLPSCVGAGERYPPITMEAFLAEFLDRNYANRNGQVRWAADSRDAGGRD